MDDRETRCAVGGWAHDGYQCLLASAAYARHGTIHGLKGIVHEQACVWHHNTNPFMIIKKGWAQLNPDQWHPAEDVLFTWAAGAQLKDTTSAAGARETARRAASYGSTVLGTPETVAAVAKHGTRIKSSGISTAHNAGVAARAGTLAGATRQAIVHNAISGAASGAMFGAGLALLSGYQKCRSGGATREEVFDSLLRELLIGAVSGGAAAAAGAAAASVTKAGDAAIWVSLIVSIIVAVVVSKTLNTLWDEFVLKDTDHGTLGLFVRQEAGLP